jgi:hypothetical protein
LAGLTKIIINPGYVSLHVIPTVSKVLSIKVKDLEWLKHEEYTSFINRFTTFVA